MEDAEQDFQEASIGISLFSCNVTPQLVPTPVIALLKSLLEPWDHIWIPRDHWLQPMCSILAGQWQRHSWGDSVWEHTWPHGCNHGV